MTTRRSSTAGTGMQRDPGGSVGFGSTTSPFVMMRRMAAEMDQLFEQFGIPRAGAALAPSLGAWLDREPWAQVNAPAARARWSPQVEIFRRGDTVVVRADVPGVQKDDLHVELRDGVLTIRGERRDVQEEEGDGYYRSERSYGQFYRAIPLPDGVSAETSDASFKDGVLEVSLAAPKPEERKAKRIQIR